jgi:hypothetical protein
MGILRRLQGHKAKSLLVASLLAAALLAAPTASADSKSPGNFTSAHAAVSDYLELTSRTFPTGSSETGHLIVDNRTKAAIDLTKECQPELEGLLQGARITQPSWSGLVCSNRALIIRPGVNRIPIRFVATYLSCSQDPNGTTGVVGCVDGSDEPSLPPGIYEAHVDGGGASLPDPRSVPVHLTARQRPAQPGS